MAITHLLVAVVGLLMFVALPALLVTVSAIDIAVERGWRCLRRAWRRFRLAHRGPRIRARRRVVATAEPAGPPIEHLAAELRRLSRARRGVATRSELWYTAVAHAYDARLRLACRALGVTEHLEELTGMDQEIERLRVAGVLESAGLILDVEDSDQPRQLP